MLARFPSLLRSSLSSLLPASQSLAASSLSASGLSSKLSFSTFAKVGENSSPAASALTGLVNLTSTPSSSSHARLSTVSALNSLFSSSFATRARRQERGPKVDPMVEMLYEQALKEGKENGEEGYEYAFQILEEFEGVVNFLQLHPELLAPFEDPTQPFDNLLQEAQDLFYHFDDDELSPLLWEFLSFLTADRNGLEGLKEFLAQYQALLFYTYKIHFVTITTAIETSEEQKEKIQSALVRTTLKPESNYHFKHEVKPEILGGLQIQIDDKFLDLSAARQADDIYEFLQARE